MDKFISSYDNCSIWQLSEKGLMELAEFVVWENYKHHTGGQLNDDFHSEVVSVCNEEMRYFNCSRVFVAKDVDNKIIGAIRLMNWDKIDSDINEFIHNNYPANYEWHFFDITYDLEIPTVYGICFGESEYGKFVAVGTATRDVYADALKKVILETGQAVAYFRYLLAEKKNWIPSDNYNELLNFEDHSVFYIKRPDLWDVFKTWTELPETKKIDFKETSDSSALKII
ncbi:MAG: YcaO-like family protein [Tannerellaceae bacterium]|nr:YcaO-like family protein [Tannerellaceae bacterium]